MKAATPQLSPPPPRKTPRKPGSNPRNRPFRGQAMGWAGPTPTKSPGALPLLPHRPPQNAPPPALENPTSNGPPPDPSLPPENPPEGPPFKCQISPGPAGCFKSRRKMRRPPPFRPNQSTNRGAGAGGNVRPCFSLRHSAGFAARFSTRPFRPEQKALPPLKYASIETRFWPPYFPPPCSKNPGPL